MKARKLIALLLCLIMVVGILPISAVAEETATVAENSDEIKFDLLIDFNTVKTTDTANGASFAALIADNEHFTATHYEGTSGLSYVDRGDGDMALRTTNKHGIRINDTDLILKDVSFVLEYDVRFEHVAGGFNTAQLCFTDNGVAVNTSLAPINANKITGADGNKYPATYVFKNNQNIGATTYPTGVATDLIAYPDQWYHYAFYINSDANTILAYRDGEKIWSSTLVSFPDTMVDCLVRLFSGHSGSITYYDNIHIQSLNSIDAKIGIDFEGIEFAEGKKPINATSDMLNDIIGGGHFKFPYVHATHTTIETDGTNNYIVGQSVGKSWAAEGAKRSFFQLSGKAGSLASQSWKLAFDMCLPGVEDASGTNVLSNYTITFLSLIADGTGNTVFTVTKNGELGRIGDKNYTASLIKKGEWNRIFASYNADTQKIAFALINKTSGYVDLGSYDFKPDKNATDTFFRFGYGYENGQYCKFYFDNITLTTDQGLDIDLDFENGKAGENVSLSDLSLGGADTYTVLNGGRVYSKELQNKFKYLDDADGNTFLGSYVGHDTTFININDFTLDTLSKKFVMSFDLKINEPSTTYTMASWRTSKANIPLWIIENVGGKTRLRIRPKLTGNSYAYSSPYLTKGTWYNFAVIIDPVNKKAEFYMDGLDTEPIYTTTFEHDISGSTWSSLSIGPGSNKETPDWLGYDNIRIYTIEESIESATPPSDINMSTLPADGIIIESDFEGFEAGTAMTSDAWDTIASFGATSVGGTVVDANGNKHFQPASGSGATSFNISSFNALPYTEGVIAIENDFSFGDNSSNSGNLVIAALKRVGLDGKTVNVPLLTADKNGKLTVSNRALDYTLPKETVKIRLELSSVFHTVNLYINNEAIATGIPLGVDTVLPSSQSLSFTDALGNAHELPFTGYTLDYAYDENGNLKKDQNGKTSFVPHYYENYGFSKTLTYVKDSIEMFGASADEAWSFAMDNLKIYLDKDADIYYNGFDGWKSGVVGTSEYGTTVGSPFAAKGAKYIDDDGNRVLSSLAEGSTTYNTSFFIKDHQEFILNKSFVLEFNIKYNPEYKSTTPIPDTGMAIVTDLSWFHALYLFPDGGYGTAAGSKSGYFKNNDWSRVQLLFTPNSAGTGHTMNIYVDGNLLSGSFQTSLLKTLRIGCEKNNYDLKLDNIRIYLADMPDVYENIITGTLDGKKLFSLEVEDKETLDELMTANKDGLTWNFKNFKTTSSDINGATTNVLIDKGDFVRVVHNHIKDTSPYNIFVNKAVLEGHKQYVFETEFRYTCPTGFELEVISMFDSETRSKDKLVYVLGTSREIVFNRNGFTYNLTDRNGNKLYAENVTDDATKFTKVSVIVDEEAGNYSVYVNGNVAYYNYGGDIVTATEIDIDKTKIFDPKATLPTMVSTISLLNMPTSTASNAFLDIKSANMYILRDGVAPYVKATQSKINESNENKFDVRFIASIDALYGSEVGFDIDTVTEKGAAPTRIKSSNIVYSSIKATDPDTNLERPFTAEEFDGTYLVVISITGIDLKGGDVEFTVHPFTIMGDSKIYSESYTVTYNNGKVVNR